MSRITVKNTAEKAAFELASYLAGEISKDGRTLNIALSGGNTPKIVFQDLTRLLSAPTDYLNVNFYWVDERCVPVDSAESNFGEFKRIFADEVRFPQSNLHPMVGTNDPESEAKRYAGLLEKNLKQENEVPVFDIIVLGMGDDGHTASIFPDQLHLFDSEDTAATARHPQSGQNRITLTGKTILNAKEVIALITGKSKSMVLKSVLEKRPESMAYPMAHVYAQKDIYWILDEEVTENF